ncbi:AMP-binding protein [Mycolicibacterium sp. A43C]
MTTNQQVSAGPTISGLTLRVLARHPHRDAFIDPFGQRTTYAEAAALIGRYQSVLTDRGLRRGSRVAILSANRMESWCTSVAAQASGMAVTWLHPLASLADHRYQIEHSEADAVIVDEHSFGHRGRELGATFSFGAADYGLDLSTAATDVGPRAPRDHANTGDVAVINYTGGTTGRPKGVLRRHPPLVAALSTILADFEMPLTPKYLAVAPNSHVGGSLLLPILARGGTIYLHHSFSPAATLRAIATERINMTLLVPTMIYALLDHPSLQDTDTTALEVLLYGAAPMSPSRLADGLRRLGPVFAQLYGQTEYHPISYLSRSDHQDPSLQGSCGALTTTTSVRILDDLGNELPPGAAGELAVKGPAAMDTYFKQKPKPEHNGWILTGDLATMDDRGYLRIVDRKKDMIISGGFNVYPREVEDALASHPDVIEAAVYGVPDEHWGELVAAAVVVRQGTMTDPNTLITHVRAAKGPLLAPKHIVLTQQLPRTTLGKIDKKALRLMHPPQEARTVAKFDSTGAGPTPQVLP